MRPVGTEHINNNRPRRHHPKIHHNTKKTKRFRYNCPKQLFKQLIVYSNVHPGKFTWKPKMEFWTMNFLFNLVMFRFHVNFHGRIVTIPWPNQKAHPTLAIKTVFEADAAEAVATVARHALDDMAWLFTPQMAFVYEGVYNLTTTSPSVLELIDPLWRG